MTVSFENVKVGDLRRFWCWVEQKESGCCEWVGKRTSDGYGVFKYEGKNRRAHRWLHELLNGAAPDGEIVRHTCDNPPCVNPAHLLVGTHLDNARDRDERKRTARNHGAKNGQAKLTASDVRAIRASSGTHDEIATKYGVSRPTVSMVRSRTTWKEVS